MISRYSASVSYIAHSWEIVLAKDIKLTIGESDYFTPAPNIGGLQLLLMIYRFNHHD